MGGLGPGGLWESAVHVCASVCDSVHVCASAHGSVCTQVLRCTVLCTRVCLCMAVCTCFLVSPDVSVHVLLCTVYVCAGAPGTVHVDMLMCTRVLNCTLSGVRGSVHSSVRVGVCRLCGCERGSVWGTHVLMCVTLHTLVCTALCTCVGVHVC